MLSSYLLITPARNEAAFIEKTLRSVTSQTLPPLKWVIVDDGSTDATAEIVGDYVQKYPWIEIVSRPKHLDRSFAGKVQAFNAGYERVKSLDFEVLGNLDADISFDRDFFEFLMGKFRDDPKLGLGGTPFTQDGGYDSAKDSFEGENYVAGGCQIFRRRCFEAIGGYTPNPAGGIDWLAATTTRYKGWKVQSFPEKRWHHYRALGTANRGITSAIFSYGEKAYYLGDSPLWHCFRVCYRSLKRPLVIGGLALGTGYLWAAIRRTPRLVSNDLMQFHRGEQVKKLKAILGSVLRFKKVDAFSVARAGGGDDGRPQTADGGGQRTESRNRKSAG